MEASQLITVSPGEIYLKGLLGKAIRTVAENRLKKVNYKFLVDTFRYRTENDGGWRGEFWGKIIRSAILTWKATGDKELLAIVKESVYDMISTQTQDGCISTYPQELQTFDWDLWGRKYALVGLLRYFEVVDADPAVLQACCKLIDHLMTQVGPEAKNIIDCGWHDGLASASILFAVVKLYRFTHDKKYLDYAVWIVNSGCSKVHNIFDAVLNGTFPKDIGNGKAYEMMSCFLGLAELYREIPEERYLKTVIRFYEMVRDREIFITGVGGMKDCWGEFWHDGKFKQCRKDSGTHGETCITTTWIHYCYTILKLTSDSKIADEIEVALYNGILGSMHPNGNAFIHGNPDLTGGEKGCKIAADDQIKRGFGTPYDSHDCCLAQGPEGLAMALPVAMIQNKDGMTLNLFEDMDAICHTPGGQCAKITISGGYPLHEKVKIIIKLEHKEKFQVKLRIPQWINTNFHIVLNDRNIPVIPGTYLLLNQEWNEMNEIGMDFDLTPVMFRDPGGSNHVAFRCGPLVLAQDSRLCMDVGQPVSLSVSSMRRAEAPEGILLQWDTKNGIPLCDYISAGNRFEKGNRLCVWMRTLEK